MSQEKKSQSLWGVIVLAAVLSGLFFWTYKEMTSEYLAVENSHKMVQSFLENQTHFVRSYGKQMDELKANFKQTEEFLAQVQAENAQLKGKLAALDNVVALEQKISQLEEANTKMRQEMELAALREQELNLKLEELAAEKNFKTVDEGRAIIAKYKKKFNEIKSRIRDIQAENRNAQIAAQKVKDDAMALMGNNGFLVRNGKVSETNAGWPIEPNPSKNVQIDVTFVK